ncbi:cytochrome c3 family protein [Ferrimonas sp.]|uniref:cytochrome c3 family protein n=1 Tax=Ferrimonas sp. TaxID=2080861 RepID=UPI003A8DCA4C
MSMHRRDALKNIIGITSCAAGAALVPGIANAADDWVLKPGERLAYARLDPAEVAALAFQDNVKAAGCMYQVFHALVTSLANSDSPDAAKWAQIPTALSVFGGAGVLYQGTICGCNNAIGMLYNILKINGEKPHSLEQISAYYSQMPLPRNDQTFLDAVGYSMEQFDEEIKVQTEAHSLLCHASLTRWSKAAGIPISKKANRCTLLSASIAWRAVELLNMELDGEDLHTAPGDSEVITQCQSCHTHEDTFPTSVRAYHMECDSCHGDN